jgi:hypothetical protein
MPVSRWTYYKALLLLTVFSLNTVVSFACSFGGIFHNFHHKHSLITVQGHSSKGDHFHKHGHEHKHVHDQSTAPNHGSTDPSDSKGNCCSDSVVELQKLDKSVSRSIEAPDIISISIHIAAYSQLFSVQAVEETLFATSDRWRPPTTIQDLRIVIQSFQI